ncbi:hypothetical protein, partial [Streptomyces sp. b94]|uniref:hypothetical protein n=1 Tax=Streptomyces sp. b94 TaxID=1827634 RepID=UPI001C54F46A
SYLRRFARWTKKTTASTATMIPKTIPSHGGPSGPPPGAAKLIINALLLHHVFLIFAEQPGLAL